MKWMLLLCGLLFQCAFSQAQSYGSPCADDITDCGIPISLAYTCQCEKTSTESCLNCLKLNGISDDSIDCWFKAGGGGGNVYIICYLIY
jgi:hypothetical protein